MFALLIAVYFSTVLSSGSFLIEIPSKSRCAPNHDPTKPDVYCVTPGLNFSVVVYYSSGELDGLIAGSQTYINLTTSYQSCTNFSCWQFGEYLLRPITALGSPPEYTKLFEIWMQAPFNTGFFSIPLSVALGLPKKSDYCYEFSPCDYSFEIEVTCSDGVFCNGEERYYNPTPLFGNGSCFSAGVACDDFTNCTNNFCDEATKLCNYEMLDPLPAGCFACYGGVSCTPNCTGYVCGDDGCGGSCGNCSAGEACDSTQHCTAVSSITGTCANPIPLDGKIDWTADKKEYSFTYDNSLGVNILVPSCNTASKAPELVFHFKTPNFVVGYDIRMLGLFDDGSFDEDRDTLMELRKYNCTNNDESTGVGYDAAIVEKCSDDSSPPGGVGSRVHGSLLPNTDYFIVADAYSVDQVGSFNLTLVFTMDGCDVNCDGLHCGLDPLCAVSCGSCGASEACDSFHRCGPNPCIPDCENRTCGDDGCDGSCGTCDEANNFLCASFGDENHTNWTCGYFRPCDPFVPTCESDCTAPDSYCGSDCKCHCAYDLLPDLIVNAKSLAEQIIITEEVFSNSSCAIYENCLLGPGKRTLIRFTVAAVNQGQAPLAPPDPKTAPNLFQWSPCHGHYHFTHFAGYWLIDNLGNVVVSGRKMAYCMEDSYSVFPGPNVPCEPQSTCNTQGLSVGWADEYGFALDCQWLDVTDVAPGNYTLRVSVNAERYFIESSFANNYAEAPVTIPGRNSAGALVPSMLLALAIAICSAMF